MMQPLADYHDLAIPIVLIAIAGNERDWKLTVSGFLSTIYIQCQMMVKVILEDL